MFAFQSARVTATINQPIIPARARLRRLSFRLTLSAIGFLILVGLLAPFINAARWSGKIRSALEFSLGRKVEFEQAHLTVFSGPGFSLENVTISEDPKFGLEPFAHVPTVKARLRFDKLLSGQLRFSSLRLVGPSLNLVRRADGSWNIVQLIELLGAPRRAPLSLFPSFEVADGRVDFKFGYRKSTLYISESDLTIYPQRSGKLLIRFSGSPARTDRAGNGFGHFRGNVNWLLGPQVQPNQLESDLTLDPSNLSELTTLIQGHDVGVHGTVSSHLHLSGPVSALALEGELHLQDVHRWDLLPSSGEDWRVRYAGTASLLAHNLDLRTVPLRPGQDSPVTLRVRANDFLARPTCSVVADLRKAPLEDLLPLAIRMGLALPEHTHLSGSLEGAVGYSSTSGWAGGLSIVHAQATLPDAPAVRAEHVTVAISGERIHFDPAPVAVAGNSLLLGGDYYAANRQAQLSISADNASIRQIQAAAAPWFGSPPGLTAFRDGLLTGTFSYSQDGSARTALGSPQPPVWRGRFEFANARLLIPGLAAPLENSRGRVVLDETGIELDRFASTLAGQPLHASYRYFLGARHPERLHVELPVANLAGIEAAVRPATLGDGLWSRLRLFRRSPPAWLTARNIEGDVAVNQLWLADRQLGTLASHFLWQGTRLEFGPALLKLPAGELTAEGAINLAGYVPRLNLQASLSGFPWKNGLLNAEGQVQTSGLGSDALQNLVAQGSFSGANFALLPEDSFASAAGTFHLSLAAGWPDLQISDLKAVDDDVEWSGEAVTQRDGTLVVNVKHEGQQLHIVSSLAGEPGTRTPVAAASGVFRH